MRAAAPPRFRLPAAMLGVALIALLVGYGAWHTSFGNNLELGTIDARISLRGTQKPYPGVVIVAIDVNTLESSRFGSFPFKRIYDAEMIDRLLADGAKTIAYDLVFDSASDYPQYDLDLLKAAERARGHLVLAADASDINGNGTTNVLGGVANQRLAGVSVGTALFSEDSDGAVRSLPEQVGGVPSFAVAAARDAGVSAGALRAEFDHGSQLIDFPGPAGTVKSYSFSDVLSPSFNPALVRGRIVVVGATAGDLQDTHTVDYGANLPMTGPELEADAISTLMTGAQLRVAPPWVNWLLVIVAALLLPALALRRVRWPRLIWTGLAAAAALLVATQIAFDDGTVNLLVPVFATLLVSAVGAVLVPLAIERRELARLRERFARFDPSVVDAVLADPGIALRVRALAIGPESVIAGYRIVALIGRGGMGVVYEAVQLTLDRPVALKLIDPAHADDPEFRARFVRESHVAAALEHPHVIPVYEAREDGGLLFIAMRLVPGPSLADLFAAEAPLAPTRAVALVTQIAGALGAAHARGLVHRDVKPANILLHSRDHAYLTDFGVSHEVGDEGLTGVGERLGTVDYMAPEQCRGELVGPAADIYSLGCVLYEALTGRTPFPATSEAERIAAHLHEPPPSASAHWPGIPVTLDAVITQALSKEPIRRFDSAAAFALAARSAVGIAEPPDSPPPPSPRVGGERPTIITS